jgi:NTE family protein
LYDEILFDGATFGDLDRGNGPFIIATATDISTGARFPFHQGLFDVLCSNLDAVPLSRAAAASSAVPVVLSPITINNYGGTCNSAMPSWTLRLTDTVNPPRPAARAIRALKEIDAYGDSVHRPYIHLVDGGVADNLGMRGVLDALQTLEALHEIGAPTPLDHVRRIIIFVVNSMSSPKTRWDESERAPGTMDILLKATGVPIEHYSYEAIELLKDTMARWQTSRRFAKSPAFSADRDPAVAATLRPPEADLYAIDVSFDALKDKVQRDYLNELPTSFVLSPDEVDRLRAAAGEIILASPEFQRLLNEVGATIVPPPPPAEAGAPATLPIAHPAVK